MNNKVILITSIMIISILMLGTIFGIIDYNRTKNRKTPLFAVKIKDAESKEYYGLGYKVIKCNTLIGDESIHFGFYNMNIDETCKNESINFEENPIDDLEREHIINQSVNFKNLTIEKQKEIIGNIIREKVNQDFINDEYIVEVSKPEANDSIVNIIYDFIFTIAGAKTNIGYTVFVNGEGTMVDSIFDNTNGYNLLNVKDENENTIKTKLSKLTEKRKKEIRKRALKKFELPNYSLTIKDEFTYFKVENKELVYIVNIVGVSNNGAMFANTYEEEI